MFGLKMWFVSGAVAVMKMGRVSIEMKTMQTLMRERMAVIGVIREGCVARLSVCNGG